MPPKSAAAAQAKKTAKEALRARICALWHADKLSMAQIAEKVSQETGKRVAKATVQSVIKNWYRKDDFSAKKNPGRPTILTKRFGTFSKHFTTAVFHFQVQTSFGKVGLQAPFLGGPKDY